MLRMDDIRDGLFGLVGWRQGYNTDEVVISDSLTESESGLFFQDAHPLLTLQNLACIAPDFENTNYPLFSLSDTYRKGAVIKYLGGQQIGLYKAKKTATGILPTDTEYWEPTNPFSEWLEEKTKAGIQQAIASFYQLRMAAGAAKSLCENKTLFDGTARICDTVRNQRNLVGFEVVPIRAKGVTTRINRIGLQFTKAGTYTLYLMHSSQVEPIQTIVITTTKDNSFGWYSVSNMLLKYDSNYDGGSYYLCYDQDAVEALDSKAIRKERDWSKEPCSTCSRIEYNSWLAWSKYIEVHPFYINRELVDFVDGEPTMWDVEKNLYTYDTNYGINLDLTVYCDLTDFVIDQKSEFVDVIYKQVALNMLKEMAYNANVRTNRHSLNASKSDLLLAIDGDANGIKIGLSTELMTAIKALSLNLAGVDRVCLPCKNGGIKYRTT